MEEKDEETSGGGSSGDGDGLFLRPGRREWTGHIWTSLGKPIIRLSRRLGKHDPLLQRQIWLEYWS
jgi:hypothetical protein